MKKLFCYFAKQKCKHIIYKKQSSVKYTNEKVEEIHYGTCKKIKESYSNYDYSCYYNNCWNNNRSRYMESE